MYPDFWYVCKFVFTLIHGQNAVESGFIINKHALFDNFNDTDHTSLRLVYNEVINHG